MISLNHEYILILQNEISLSMKIDKGIVSHALEHYTYLHRHPELSFHESGTRNYVENVLSGLDISYERVGSNGIVAMLPGKDSGRTIALRADMDALPITEDDAHEICSLHPGIMHACGHDLHTACLLGAAEYMCRQSAQLPVNVMLIFQHAEELLPGGAVDILESPFFKRHLPEWIIGQHAEPDLEVGHVGVCPGPYMASGDEIYITLRGPGGHAALPHQSRDLLLISSHIVVALQQITSRLASPQIPTVLTFGNIRCQSSMNIIPKEVTLEGTFRTFDGLWRAKAKEHIRQISQAIAESMGAESEIRIVEGYPVLYNDTGKTLAAIEVLKRNLGRENISILACRMTTDDFARYSQKIPATFLRLGVRGESNCGKLHTSGFYADPSVLLIGIQTLCCLALSYTKLIDKQLI